MSKEGDYVRVYVKFNEVRVPSGNLTQLLKMAIYTYYVLLYP